LTRLGAAEPRSAVQYQDVRGQQIVQLTYPRHKNESKQVTENKEGISYEFAWVEAARNNVTGFLFVKQRINLRNTLSHFFAANMAVLNNLTVCSPRALSRVGDRPVDRIASLKEAYAEIQGRVMPKSVEFFILMISSGNFALPNMRPNWVGTLNHRAGSSTKSFIM